MNDASLSRPGGTPEAAGSSDHDRQDSGWAGSRSHAMRRRRGWARPGTGRPDPAHPAARASPGRLSWTGSWAIRAMVAPPSAAVEVGNHLLGDPGELLEHPFGWAQWSDDELRGADVH